MGARNPFKPLLTASTGLTPFGPPSPGSTGFVDHGLGEAYEVVRAVHDNLAAVIMIAGLDFDAFALKTHNHDSQYQAKGSYALADHVHNDMQPKGDYALADHDHDDRYVLKTDGVPEHTHDQYIQAQQLAQALAFKADKSTLDALSVTVGQKANADAVTTLLTFKANQSDLVALTTAVAAKATQAALDSLTTTVGNKADAAAVSALLAQKATLSTVNTFAETQTLSKALAFGTFNNTTPANGQIWYDGTTFKKRLGGVTSDLVSGGSGLPAGGTTGQILTKKSATDGDAEWKDAPASSSSGGSPHHSLMPHRYWGVSFVGSRYYALAVAEFELRATPDGADQCVGGTASATLAAEGAASNAVDNDNATFWGTNSGGGVEGQYYSPQRWTYDFGPGNPKTVQQLAIRARNNAGLQTPRSGTVIYSDDGVTYYPAFHYEFANEFGDGEQRLATNPLLNAVSSGGGGSSSKLFKAAGTFRFDGAGAAAVHNVVGATVTRVGQGRYKITFDTPMPNTNYGFIGSGKWRDDALNVHTTPIVGINRGDANNKTVNECIIIAREPADGGVYDTAEITFLIWESASLVTALVGSGSGGSAIEEPCIKPLLTNFTQQGNNVNYTLAQTSRGVALRRPSGSGSGMAMAKMSAVPGANFTLTARMAETGTTYGAGYNCCLILRNSTSGRIIIFGNYDNGFRLLAQNWASYSSYGNDIRINYGAAGVPWRRITLNAGTLTLQTSPDGEEWSTFATVSAAAYINAAGGTIDQVGFGSLHEGGSFICQHIALA